jgi:hypothetical protein
MRYGWILQKQRWAELWAHIRDLEWNEVQFDDAYTTSVPSRPGIYLICGSPPGSPPGVMSNFFNVLYAGRSGKSMQSRFARHCRTPDNAIRELHECFGATTMRLKYFFAEAPAFRVAEIESCFIDCFGPSVNKRSGDVINAVVRAPYSAG